MHAFSVDVEDWYQGVGIPYADWPRYERRLDGSMNELLDLMGEYGVTATCFVLGHVAEHHPELVRRMHREGHEVASHGYTHTDVHELTPPAFRNELRRSVRRLEDLTGAPVVGYRAPFFTVTERTLWALDVLAEEGIRYDSSIQAVRHPRYGIPSARRTPHVIETASGPIAELPVACLPLAPGFNLPAGGGAYLRVYPYLFWKLALRLLAWRGERFSLYTHPWEIDVDQPHEGFAPEFGRMHYVNLASTRPKLEKLFRDFRFGSYQNVYSDLIEPL